MSVDGRAFELQEPMREQKTLPDLVAAQAAKYGGRTFLFFKDEEISFHQMECSANQIANGLRKLGIGKNDKVALALPNSPIYAQSIFGIAKLGAVQVSVNTGLRGGTLLRVMNHSDSKVVFTTREFLPYIAALADELIHNPIFVLCGEETGKAPTFPFETIDYVDFLSNDADAPNVDIAPSDPLAIFFTSGTTGPSKGVVLPQNYAFWHASQRIRLMQLTPNDRWYTCLPLFHVNAQFVTFMSAWTAGGQVVLGERFSASRFWDEIRRYDVTGFNMSGTIPAMLLAQQPSELDGIHNARLALGNLTKARLEEFEKRFRVRCIQSFGMTECSPVFIETVDAKVRPSMGRPIVDHEVRIVDENDNEVPPGVVGELTFRPRSPYSMLLGYYKQPEATLEAMRNLWFHTGDLVYRDEDGHHFFADRKKDSIRRRGENISSVEVQAAVNSHPNVQDSAAIAVPSELGEDEVKIVVQLKTGSSLAAEELIEYLEMRLPVFAMPRYVEFVNAFPRTLAMGRIEKYKLRENWNNENTWERTAAVRR